MTVAGSPALNKPLRSLALAEAEKRADEAEQASRRKHDRDTLDRVRRLCGLADRLDRDGATRIHANDPASYRWGYQLKDEAFSMFWILRTHYPLIVAAHRARQEAEIARLDEIAKT